MKYQFEFVTDKLINSFELKPSLSWGIFSCSIAFLSSLERPHSFFANFQQIFSFFLFSSLLFRSIETSDRRFWRYLSLKTAPQSCWICNIHWNKEAMNKLRSIAYHRCLFARRGPFSPRRALTHDSQSSEFLFESYDLSNFENRTRLIYRAIDQPDVITDTCTVVTVDIYSHS